MDGLTNDVERSNEMVFTYPYFHILILFENFTACSLHHYASIFFSHYTMFWNFWFLVFLFICVRLHVYRTLLGFAAGFYVAR